MKLAAELARPDTGRTLYILDEPTTGLHLDDVRKLLDVVHRLADLGNTVVDHRAQPRGHQDGRLGDRPRPRGRPRRRRGRRRGDARGRSPQTQGEPHRRDPQAACSPPARTPSGPGSTPRPPRAGRSPRPRQAADARASSDADVKLPWEIDGRTLAHPRPRRPAPASRSAGTAGSSSASSTGSRSSATLRPDRLVAAHQRPDQRPRARRDPVFFQATTGHEWIVTLRFRVPRNTFKPETLADQLAAAPFHEGPTPVLSDAPRLTVADGKGGMQEIVITCHAAADLETPAFDAFLTRAWHRFKSRGSRVGWLSQANCREPSRYPAGLREGRTSAVAGNGRESSIRRDLPRTVRHFTDRIVRPDCVRLPSGP